MGFLEFFKKTIGSIHYIPGIYPYGVSFLTPIHFSVPSLIFDPLVAKYLVSALLQLHLSDGRSKIGFPEFFEKNYWFY